MATNKIKVNTNLLASDAQAIAENISNIEGWITALENDYTALDAMWDGPANQVYAAMFRNDIEKIRTCINKLKLVNQYEHTAKNKYNNCENEVNSTIAGVRV